MFVVVAVRELSSLLNTGLDDETLRVCVQLLEAGVNPEALATVVQELRRESGRIQKVRLFTTKMEGYIHYPSI